MPVEWSQASLAVALMSYNEGVPCQRAAIHAVQLADRGQVKVVIVIMGDDNKINGGQIRVV